MRTRLPLLLFAMLALTAPAGAYNGGISGYSGNPAINNGMSCESCHGGGATPIVDLSGPMTVTPGSMNTYALKISGGQAAGGQTGYGSLDVSATSGALAAFEAGTQLMGGEIVQTAKKLAVNGDVTFSFSWTAPQAPGMATLFGAGLSSDGGGPSGDELARVALIVNVASLPVPNEPPVADPGGPYSGTIGAPIMFDGSKSYDPEGKPIASYAWDFGDGSLGTGPKATHAYASAGTFTVKLTVTDDKGETDTKMAVANVNMGTPQNQPPSAFAGGPYLGGVGMPIPLDGSLSKDPDGTIASYDWAFGDGTTGSGAKVMHAYTGPGSYTVTLTVKDNEGATASDKASAVVYDASEPLLPVALYAPRKVTVGPDQERLLKIRVAVDLSGLPPGTVDCGKVTLSMNGTALGDGQDICVEIKDKKEDDDPDGDDRDGKKEKKKREHNTLRIKTTGGVAATVRPWHGSRGKGAFDVPITSLPPAPSIVIWKVHVVLAGMTGDALATTEVRKAGKQ